MEPAADLGSRVTRLEVGFCAGMVLIFSAIIASYLMLAGKIDAGVKQSADTTVSISEARGDIKVLNERTLNMDKKLDAIASKVGAQ